MIPSLLILLSNTTQPNSSVHKEKSLCTIIYARCIRKKLMHHNHSRIEDSKVKKKDIEMKEMNLGWGFSIEIFWRIMNWVCV
jgi:hypothetical protein